MPWPLEGYFHKYNWQWLDQETEYVELTLGTQLKEFMHCSEKSVTPNPIIVPPTWNKTEYHESLSRVWSKAAKELASAENIIIIGYSLPPSDPFFHFLYSLGTVGDKPLKRFWVFNPDNTGLVEKRFKDMLGPAATARYKYFTQKFDTAIGTIRQEFL